MASGATRSIGALIWIAASVIRFLLVVAFDQRLEPVEAGIPELLPLTHPPLGFLERPGVDADEVRAANLAPSDQPRVLQHLHVLGGAGEGHSKRLAELTNRFLAEGEASQHSAPRRVGQRMERHVESIINHVVEYRTCSTDCQPIS